MGYSEINVCGYKLKCFGSLKVSDNLYIIQNAHGIKLKSDIFKDYDVYFNKYDNVERTKINSIFQEFIENYPVIKYIFNSYELMLSRNISKEDFDEIVYNIDKDKLKEDIELIILDLLTSDPDTKQDFLRSLVKNFRKEYERGYIEGRKSIRNEIKNILDI